MTLQFMFAFTSDERYCLASVQMFSQNHVYLLHVVTVWIRSKFLSLRKLAILARGFAPGEIPRNVSPGNSGETRVRQSDSRRSRRT